MKRILGTHQLSLRIKRDLFHSLHHLPHDLIIYTRLSGHLKQCKLCWIPDSLAVNDGGIIRQDGIVQDITVQLIVQIQLFRVQNLTVDKNLLNSHLILRQGTCLV